MIMADLDGPEPMDHDLVMEEDPALDMKEEDYHRAIINRINPAAATNLTNSSNATAATDASDAERSLHIAEAPLELEGPRQENDGLAYNT